MAGQGGIYNSYHEIESLPLGAENCVGIGQQRWHLQRLVSTVEKSTVVGVSGTGHHVRFTG
jgi:hypothetical protein